MGHMYLDSETSIWTRLPDERSEKPLVDYVEQYGTRDLAGFLAIPAALEYMQRQEWNLVRTRCHDMALDAKRTVESIFDTESICPEEFEWFSQLCPIRLPDQTNMEKLSKIFREQYKIEIPLITWHDIKIARLSVQIYTSQDEIDTIVQALKQHVSETMTE